MAGAAGGSSAAVDSSADRLLNDTGGFGAMLLPPSGTVYVGVFALALLAVRLRKFGPARLRGAPA